MAAIKLAPKELTFSTVEEDFMNQLDSVTPVKQNAGEINVEKVSFLTIYRERNGFKVN